MTAIASAHVSAEVFANGGMLCSPAYRLADGRIARPFAEAAWGIDPAFDDLTPPYLRRLGSAFVAMPFGGRAVPANTGEWPVADGHAPLHGIAACACWTEIDRTDESVRLRLELPETTAVAWLEQTIACHPDRAAVTIDLTIATRCETVLAAGYHPVLRLPKNVKDLSLKAAFASGYVSPIVPDMPLVTSGARFGSLEAVDGRDFSRLPLDQPGEALLLLARCDGEVCAEFHDEGYRVRIRWDQAVLPNCLLWLHDRGGDFWPGEHTFRGIGIEPSATAFDLAEEVSAESNPLTRMGERTALTITPDAVAKMRFEIAVEQLA